MRNSELFKHWATFNKGMDATSVELSLASHLEYSLSKDQYTATPRDIFHALALAVRDRLVERWIRTQQTYYDVDAKRVCYLSAEYLMGRALTNTLINLGLYDETKRAMEDLHLDFDQLVEQETDAGLGNGGLGRLAACLLDSLATLAIPAIGYGIRYEFGIFEQALRNGAQIEHPDEWLKLGNPWEIARPERNYVVHFYGHVAEGTTPEGRYRAYWSDTIDVVGIAYDTPVNGHGNNTVNTLRLWSARSSKAFDLDYFQHGDYLKAVEDKNLSENISKVLYPNDKIFQGRELRLKQQYFFVSCSIQDIIRRHLVKHSGFDNFPEKVSIQLNDTHPSLAIVELLRILLDDHHLEWDRAWEIVTKTFSYTNHTLLSEALEQWPAAMFGKLLPRHLALIGEVNRRHLREVAICHPSDTDRLRRMSLFSEEGGEKKVRMAHLAIVGSHAVNGVSELHTNLLKTRVFPDFDDMLPGRFLNITNGVTHRRWLLGANPGLAELITQRIGDGWIRDLNALHALEEHAADPELHARLADVRTGNKRRLTLLTEHLTGVRLDPGSLFDVQVKRIHEYKRQLLNILHVASLWMRLKEGDGDGLVNRSYIFGGKAAPAYAEAKLIIRLITSVAETVNADPATADRLRVAFLPNYRVQLAEQIIPAADVSEQISTAGFEASGTGNMKFMLNGALTIGTLDGANIEMRDEVGPENIFIFGLTAGEVEAMRPSYEPRRFYEEDPELKRTLDLVASGFFSPQDPGLFRPLIDHLLTEDRYFVLADYAAYRSCQEAIETTYRTPAAWWTRSVLNIARSGRFTTDRTVADYNRMIWKAGAVPITRE
jgi:starch phosphorylase